MTPLIPVLTRDGLRAVFRADHEGLQARIAEIAFGDRGYSPTGEETELQNERVRVPIAGGSWVGDFTIHMTALLDAGPSFWLREVGLILTDGTLLAVWSHETTPLAYKTAGVPIVTAFDLSLEALPASAVTVEAGDIDLTLFFGSEFAQLGAAVLGNARRIQAQDERVEALEELPGAIAAHTAMIGRLGAESRQLDRQASELLGLAARLGTTALNNTGRIQAQGERVEVLEELPGAIAALITVIERTEAANRQLDRQSGELLGLAVRLGTTALNNTGRIQSQGERVEALEELPSAIAAHTAMIERVESESRQLDRQASELLGLAAQLGSTALSNTTRIQAQGERVEALEELPGAIAALIAVIERMEAANRELDTRSDQLLGLAAQLGATALGDTTRILAQDQRVKTLENLPDAVSAVTEVIGRMASDVDRLKAAQPPGRNTHAYQAHGSYSFVVPAGVTRIHGRLVGGGGGAAGVGQSSTVGGAAKPGGGGGAGGAAEGWFDVVPGQVLPIEVGAGGAGGAASANVLNANGGNGGNGGSSSIGAMSATGGGGGIGDPSAGGPGGAGTGGSLNTIGGMGGDGGGAAGTRIYGGNGGASIFGGGGRAATSYAASICDGKAPGSGGGSVYHNWAAGGKGGDGADGAVILQW